MMALIELEGVSKAFYADRKKSRARIALDMLDLSIEQGEFVSLVGPSGCGKTLTLNLIAGFQKPSIGQVRFKGKRVAGPGPERGVVFQEYSLFPWLSAKDNVVYALRNALRGRGARLSAQELDKRAMHALATVGLQDAADSWPNTLSGGMKQRVAIARLLAMDSEVLLMDEPFSALDEQMRQRLDEGMLQLWRHEGKTIVFVTHDIAEAVRISSRIVLFSDSPGRVLGQWSLPDAGKRDPLASPYREVGDQVRALLPSTSCQFSFGQE